MSMCAVILRTAGLTVSRGRFPGNSFEKTRAGPANGRELG